MAKAVGIFAGNNYDDATGKIALAVTVAVRDTGVAVNPGFQFDALVYLMGTENPTQITGLVNTKIKSEVLARAGITLVDIDITTTKFV